MAADTAIAAPTPGLGRSARTRNLPPEGEVEVKVVEVEVEGRGALDLVLLLTLTLASASASGYRQRDYQVDTMKVVDQQPGNRPGGGDGPKRDGEGGDDILGVRDSSFIAEQTQW